jgi:hypothetical protein
MVVSESKGMGLMEFFIKFNEEEQEEEYYLMDEVFQKLWYYAKDKELKTVITPKTKLSHLL